ncbi:hypothetical protein M5X11_19130 [Paenibacillus alginolyticus]|uniref:hypothetical protein n=1 Tax=Paenibacillus alginolyticus TaxID=59839 RepID=UPI0004167E40|nr:hypothetical protein [Paenibacillus alginolyticus]MCY9667021.1 hypothetical protein [Paenibacillus alginolyticus]
MTKWLTLLLAAAIGVLSAPQLSRAEQELAAPSAMPYVTLLDEFTLYASKNTRSNEAIGSLSAFQSVHLAPIESSTLLGITRMDKVPVMTWLGVAWINLKEGAYKYGQMELQEQKLTLLEQETDLYDSASTMKKTEYKLSPQTVQAIASISVCDPYTPCYSNDKWYLIKTSWLGDKWIRPYHYAEKYKGSQVEGMISIEQETEVYMLPFEKPLTDEPKLPPQIVKPIEKYNQQARMVPPSIWYKVDTSKGIRWIHADDSHGLGFEGVEKVDLNLDIPVPFHYFKLPFPYSVELPELQQPQTVHAIGELHGWYFVVSDGSGKWINLAKEISSHLTGDFDNDAKFGVKLNDVSLELTAASIALDTPLTTHVLTFTPQTVTASREWKSPNGEMWYYIHTWLGAKWVRI